MMRNFFWWGVDVGTFVFPGFEVNSQLGLIFTCLGVFCFSILSEAIRALLMNRAREVHLVPPDESESNDQVTINQRRRNRQESFSHHGTEALLYTINLFASYILMLAAMTFNVPVFLSVIFGSGVGFFLFRNNYFINMSNTVNRHMISDESSTEPLTRDTSIEPGPSTSQTEEAREDNVINASVIVHT